MSDRGYLLGRVAWAVVAVWIVLSATWAFVALTQDPNRALAMWGVALSGGDAAAAGEAYEAARGRSGSLFVQYVRVMTNLVTLQWGYSVSRNAPVLAVVGRGIVVSTAYLLPAVVVSVVAGVAGGLLAAIDRQTARERVILTLAYVGVSVPSFVLAVFAQRYVVEPLDLGGNVAETAVTVGSVRVDGLGVVLGIPGRLAVAGAVVTALLLASQVRYARAESLEHLGTAYAKTARAKGAGPWRVARHALRNAALPLVSLVFTDVLGVLVVSMIVIELVLGIPGLGAVTYGAAQARDVPLLLGATLVPVVFGVVGNLVQDLAYTLLDPRVGLE